MASIAIAVLFYYVRPAGQIWRGDTSRVQPFHALTVGFAFGGIAVALGGVTRAAWPKHLHLAGRIR